ncbi:MAG: trigger factor [Clostridiales bacterium]|nr:trigger factor [Clostridiales bacterium]MDD6389662.1 trigger factor [Bacillota bacterium]MDY5976022.1 trigger factor [Anaerovoracaceae bacterium]
MKKLLAVLAGITVLAGTVLTGCGSSDQYNYDLSEYVKVGEYKGLTYDKPEEISVSQDEIDDAIKEDLEGAKYLKDVEDGKVHDGDTTNIDYVGTIDGEEFEGGTAQQQTLVIGSGSFIDGFEDGLIGSSVGDTVTLDLTFPEDYENNKDVAGKDVQFKVTINASQEYVTPTESYYVKNNTEYESVSDYEDSVEKELYDAAEEEQKQAIRDSLWDQIEQSSEVIKYPEKEMNEYKEKTRKSIQDYAEENDVEYADLLDQYYGMTEEEFEEELTNAAQTNCKAEMIVYYIASQEGFEITDEEYESFVEGQLSSMGYTADEFKEYTGSSYVDYVGGENYIRYYMLYTKVMDMVVENAVEK